MPLLTLDQIRADLRCPRCVAPLATVEQGLACTGPCDLASREPFPILDGLPLLVDFERSVLQRERYFARAGASEIDRGAIAPARGLRGAVRDLLEPPNRIARSNAERVLRLAADLAPRPRVLVIGGGRATPGVEALYERPEVDLVGFDIYRSPLVQFVADAHQVPLANGTIHAVWIQAVLEHVLDPAIVVREIHRVLAPGGLVYAETPFMQHVHEGPYDFTRFTESGHRWLFREFERIDADVVAGLTMQLAWSVEAWVTGLTRSRNAGAWARRLVYGMRVFDSWIPRAYHVDGASGFYFLGRRSETPLTPIEAIEQYRGAQKPPSGN